MALKYGLTVIQDPHLWRSTHIRSSRKPTRIKRTLN